MTVPAALDRGGRRRARTRAALIGAAQVLLARRGGTDASIQEITDIADVGFGSFYNHFTTKAELFDAAIVETLDEHGALLDEYTAGIEDPADVFSTSVRLTARMLKTHPQMASTIRNTGMKYLTAERGLAPRAVRDIVLARDAGRFVIGSPAIALACVGGALLGVLQVLDPGMPPREIDRASDELARYVLLMFGLPPHEADAISTRRLPAVTPTSQAPRAAQ